MFLTRRLPQVLPAETTSHAYGGVELKGRSLPHLLEIHAAANADKPFVQCWDEGLKEEISFTQMLSRVEGAATALQKGFAVGRGVKCAILSHNSPAYVTLSLAIMRCRGTSVNLNWRSPAVQLASLVERVKPKVLFASAAFRDQAHSPFRFTRPNSAYSRRNRTNGIMAKFRMVNFPNSNYRVGPPAAEDFFFKFISVA